MKAKNVAITSTLVVALLFAFFFLPLPVTRIREPGLVQVHPKANTPIYVEVPGILTKIHVEESKPVKKGQIIAEFLNAELESKRDQARTEIAIKTKLVNAYDIQLSTTPAKDKKKVMDQRLDVEKEKLAAEGELRAATKSMEPLVIRAPADGIVMGLPRVDEIGKYWEKDNNKPFCTIGNPGKLRVAVPVTQANYELLIENVKKRKGTPLDATIRVQGHGGAQWKGKIAVDDLPKAEEKKIPLALSTRGGGPLAIKPTQDPNQLVPQEQIYLVPVDFLVADTAICPGTMAQVKIHCEYRSASWAVWRWLSATFDLGLAF